jgi:ketosteroid isomerase-like protein
VTAYNAGDLAHVVGYYADELIKDRQGAASEKKTQTVERIAQVLRDDEGRLSVSNDEIVTSGDFAYTRGTLEITLQPRTGGPVQLVRRRFLEIWRKQDGQWLVARTMDNTSAP